MPKALSRHGEKSFDRISSEMARIKITFKTEEGTRSVGPLYIYLYIYIFIPLPMDLPHQGVSRVADPVHFRPAPDPANLNF